MPPARRSMRRTARRTSRRTSRRAASRQAAAAPPQQVVYEQAPAPAAPAAPAPAETDAYAQLKQLGDLHAQGILTDEEFAAEKAKLLGN